MVQRSESFLSPLMSLSCHTGLAYLAILYFKIEIEFHVAKMINWPSTTSTQNWQLRSWDAFNKEPSRSGLSICWCSIIQQSPRVFTSSTDTFAASCPVHVLVLPMDTDFFIADWHRNSLFWHSAQAWGFFAVPLSTAVITLAWTVLRRFPESKEC